MALGFLNKAVDSSFLKGHTGKFLKKKITTLFYYIFPLIGFCMLYCFSSDIILALIWAYYSTLDKSIAWLISHLGIDIFPLASLIDNLSNFDVEVKGEAFNITRGYSTFILQVLFIILVSIWSRAAGPRMRPDQLSDITWKEFFVLISSFILLVLIGMSFIW